jgi:hypothetical protein
MATGVAFPDSVRRALGTIAREVAIQSPFYFRIAGEAPEMAQSEVTEYPNEALGDPLVHALTDRLYARYYCCRRAPADRVKAASDMLAHMAQANSSREGWDGGWTIVSRDDGGTAVVRSGGRIRLVKAGSYRIESIGPAGSVAIARRREDSTLQEDYYYAYGEALGDRYEELVDARLYLNFGAEVAVKWTALLTREFNAYQLPFTLKVLRHAASYERVDTCIVYLPRRHVEFAASVALDLARIEGGLRAATPLFTRRIGVGLALGDNPPGGTSFGLFRMRLVAEAIVAMWRSGRSGATDRMRAITTQFRAAGLDLRRPWLNPGNVDFVVARPNRRFGLRPGAGPTQWIDVANRIGARLLRDALWSGDQCTWLGWSVIPGSESGKPAVCTAGGDLYTGGAGIAVFLAHLAKLTLDERCRTTALAGLRHAIARSRRGYWPVGAYAGLAGLFYAATTVASALGSTEAAEWVPMLFKRLVTARPADVEVDVIEGRAGAIRALLTVGRCREVEADRTIELARRFGFELLDLANKHGEQWSWRTRLGGHGRDVLGYSHGTAGIAGALHELADVTHEPRLREGASRALNYEWANFDAAHNNWPDLRRVSAAAASGSDSDAPLRFMSAWCSGAPGTALALARMKRSDDDPVRDRYLDVAIETALKTLGPGAERSFCLCHGVAGNAEILLEIARLTGREKLRNAALEAAEAGMRAFHDSGNWPCGVRDGGDSPGLMLGFAGVGLFYLRLHDPAIDSPLVL